MKKQKKYLLILVTFLILFSYNTTYADNLMINGKSGILIERNSGRILYSYNPHLKLPMASTTKIMTALLALDYGNLDDIVKVKRSAVGIEGSSIYLKTGEEITLRDLVYGLMLRSGNDAAVAIAEHISGSVNKFAQLMNKRAKEIGAKNTNFTNPHGLHNDNHYTTAYDLAIITREALKNEEFRKIVKTNLWVANRPINKYFYNKNKTIRQYEGGDGVKIGYTTRAGRCLVASATRNNMQLIAVVLDDYSWFNDCYKLFDYGFSNYKPMVIYEKNQFIKNIKVLNGKSNNLQVVADKTVLLPLKEEEKKDIKTIIKLPKEIKAPIKKGQVIGKIKVFLEGKLISSNNLIAFNSIKEKGILDKITDFIGAIVD
ncbi:D-alanyl-D-alanine carboxypeptidase family protein [Thermohalobacter berrensis]|uniref:serine-type D-Ala-D-Ala carboxypeptidase n=1 Tax=Thermohalobacter berrensis TaxID=99594 RepID=A0A419TAP3_9FIRM|nr:D-alanyl-D-alanine carboxypeptidase family protein [Thermohalobacter berrensis]RKD34540.1 D-alanyl-D-alanine carboxypeptidase [Thermohalobacter berrensis]